MKGISDKLKVSMVYYDKFRFKGMDLEAKNEKYISTEDYVKILEPITKIQKAGKGDKFKKIELKEYRKYR